MGGGGYSLQNSSSAASGTGDQSQSGSFYGGSINMGNPNQPNYVLLGALALAALWLWKKA